MSKEDNIEYKIISSDNVRDLQKKKELQSAVIINQSDYDESSFLSKLFFIWASLLINKGAISTVEEKDLPGISVLDDSNLLCNEFNKCWQNEIERAIKIGCKPSLTRTLFKQFSPKYGFDGIILIVEACVRIYQAKLLGRLVAFFLASNTDPHYGIDNKELQYNGYFISFLLVFGSFIITFLHHHMFMRAWRFGMQLKITMTSVIYQKAVHLNLASIAEKSTGHIVNLCSQDVETFQQAGCFIHFTYAPLLESFGILYFGMIEIGLSFLIGFILILLLVPLQSIFSRMLSTSKSATALSTDDRLKLTSQALTGVRLMKINGWEGTFVDIIEKIRVKEVLNLMKTNSLRAYNEAIFFVCPIIISCVAFITYTQAQKGTLTTEKVFTVLSLFNILQFSMTKFFPYAIQFLTECAVAIRRIERTLVLEEHVVDKNFNINSNENSNIHIDLKNVTASWNINDNKDEDDSINDNDAEGVNNNYIDIKNVDEDINGIELVDIKANKTINTLSKISLSITKGELIVVVGPVGSSKSSLLMAILGEINIIDGSININNKNNNSNFIAYCAQETFIMSTTVRENILFGKEYNEIAYNKVISSCSMVTDLNILPHGDHTVIGDRGINLSGGQKARIGLARAMYSKSNIFLFDDPLSAVDSKVGNDLFENAICGELIGKSTRVLVTHQVQFLASPHVSRIIVMDNGSISSMGTYEDLNTSGALDWVKNMEEEYDDEDDIRDSNSENNRSRLNSTASETTSINRKIRTKSDVSDQTGDIIINDDINKELVAVKDGITVAEDKATGTVNNSVYLEYFKTIGLWKSFFGFFLMILAQFLAVSSNIILANWSRMDEMKQNDMENIMFYLYFVIGTIIVSFIRSICIFSYTIEASQLLHNQMLRSVIRAPILFFDSNPIGRLINRFAKDVATADDQLPMVIYDFLQCFFMVLAAILVVSSGLPYIFITLIPMTYYFVTLRNKYLMTSREVKRLESISRSPIFTHLTESLEGVVTLRSYNRRDSFLEVSKNLIDTNMRAYFAFQSCSRWLGFRLDAMVVLLLFISTFGAVYCKNINAIEPSLLAVGIMYVIQCSGLFQWCVRLSAELENMMISVERIISFTSVKSEPELHCGIFPENWPEHGEIELKNLECTYRVDLPPVIIDVSVKIKAGERVGIVGRTGSGKSTLIGALLRLVDITSGDITLDGIDITDVGLHDLRPKISVIPQVPFIFSGTVRANLDTFNKFTDDVIWTAIDAVGLRGIINKLPNNLGLLGEVNENGSNFSVGERQLLCLARAILQRNKILIMDEATASVDMETDDMVQKAIRREFFDSTVIMIAHRLQTIIDCDKVLVMSLGKLIEFDHPYILLKPYFEKIKLTLLESNTNVLIEKEVEKIKKNIPSNSFASMVIETGPIMSINLWKAAIISYGLWESKKNNKKQ